MGRQVTDEAISKISTIVVNSIGAKILDGINWALILNNDSATINEYEAIRQELKDMGYNRGEVLRAVEAPNGLIYDIDSEVIKKLMINTLSDSDIDPLKVGVDTAYIARRNSEFQKMHVYLMREFKQGHTNVSVALFSTNKGDKITYQTTVQEGRYGGKKIEISLPAFALRHWDLQEFNRDYLIPSRIKISRVQIIEILPTRTGVGFNFELIGLDE